MEIKNADIFKKICIYASEIVGYEVQGCKEHCPFYDNICGKGIYDFDKDDFELMKIYLEGKGVKFLTYRNILPKIMPKEVFNTSILYAHTPYEVFLDFVPENTHWDEIVSMDFLNFLKRNKENFLKN